MMRTFWACALALAFGAPLFAAGANRYQFRPKDMASNPSWKVPQFILADTEADLPSLQVYEGDLAYTKDSDKLWKRDSSSWVEVGPGSGDLSYQVIRDEGAALTARPSLNFTGAGVSCVDNSVQARTDCTISGGSGGGGGNGVEVSVAMTDGLGSATVTGQAWVGSSSAISCSPIATTADGLTEDAYTIAALSSVVSARVAGTGFTLSAVSALKPTGTFRFGCLGVP